MKKHCIHLAFEKYSDELLQEIYNLQIITLLPPIKTNYKIHYNSTELYKFSPRLLNHDSHNRKVGSLVIFHGKSTFVENIQQHLAHGLRIRYFQNTSY